MIPHNPLAVHDSFSQMAFRMENACWSWKTELITKTSARRELELALSLGIGKQAPVEETPAALEPDMDGHEDPHPLFCERELIAVHAEDAYRSEATEDDEDDDKDTLAPVETDDEDEAGLRDDEDIS
jgi:hypothetical protein